MHLAPLNELRNIFGPGKREAGGIWSDVKSNIYRRTLAKAFNTELASVPSKAAFLQILCEKLQFDPELASKMHEEIYRQKLQQFVADGELSKEEVEALMAFQVRLCIPQETVDAAHTDICGQLFEKVVKEAIASVDGYDADRREAVKKAAQSLNLKKEAVMEIFSKASPRGRMKQLQMIWMALILMKKRTMKSLTEIGLDNEDGDGGKDCFMHEFILIEIFLCPKLPDKVVSLGTGLQASDPSRFQSHMQTMHAEERKVEIAKEKLEKATAVITTALVGSCLEFCRCLGLARGQYPVIW
ncbi:hypothetical protein C2845_PM01G38670 [Panicum miliaceum]|uniref:Uncharacterized protein n=1 Tax=Panicum miliaceum TaxID=4540 RepID=A0A3L6TSK9_PANMI|nr:hypothetical protein C2845_PM01G38670 [Panicum miliaceum]